MATTSPAPPPYAADLARVQQALDMIAPRWSVWTLQTLHNAAEPLRYTDVHRAMPWLNDPTPANRLGTLTRDGLVQRREHTTRNVEYTLTLRGRQLSGVHQALGDWAAANLENVGPTARAQQAEDALTLITASYVTPILWQLRHHGPMKPSQLRDHMAPKTSRSLIPNKIRQLTADGLVERAEGNAGYQLTEEGRALAGAYTALSAWAAGQDPDLPAHHPVWNPAPANATAPAAVAPQQARQAERSPEPVAAAARAVGPRAGSPARAQRTEPAWRRAELFSHTVPGRPVRPATGTPTAGRTR